MRPYPSQLTPLHWHTPFDKGDLTLRMGPSTNLKPTYTPLPSVHGCRHHVPPILIPCYKNRVSKTTWFEPQTVDVPTCPHSRVKRTEFTKPHGHTQPINCNFIPQKDTMVHYMAQTRHLLNRQVLAIFPPSSTTPAR